MTTALQLERLSNDWFDQHSVKSAFQYSADQSSSRLRLQHFSSSEMSVRSPCLYGSCGKNERRPPFEQTERANEIWYGQVQPRYSSVLDRCTIGWKCVAVQGIWLVNVKKRRSSSANSYLIFRQRKSCGNRQGSKLCTPVFSPIGSLQRCPAISPSTAKSIASPSRARHRSARMKVQHLANRCTLWLNACSLHPRDSCCGLNFFRLSVTNFDTAQLFFCCLCYEYGVED